MPLIVSTPLVILSPQKATHPNRNHHHFQVIQLFLIFHTVFWLRNPEFHRVFLLPHYLCRFHKNRTTLPGRNNMHQGNMVEPPASRPGH